MFTVVYVYGLAGGGPSSTLLFKSIQTLREKTPLCRYCLHQHLVSGVHRFMFVTPVDVGLTLGNEILNKSQSRR
jgi:hypothetical protein